MLATYYHPHPALLDFVETVCVMEHTFTQGEPLSPIYTFMPSHTLYICFHLEDRVKVKKGAGAFEERPRSIIIGPHCKPVVLDLGKKYTDIAVALKPCGLYRLLGIHLSELIECDFDASLILGKEISEMTEQLMAAADHEKKNSIVQNYLLSKLSALKPAQPVDMAMLQLVRAHGNLTMDFLASQSCLSVRQLERQSLKRIGFSPKYFARLVRFSNAHKYKEQFPNTPWTEIAYQAGYYDQMHLIRDFRHFTGMNPSTINEKTLVSSVKMGSIDL